MKFINLYNVTFLQLKGLKYFSNRIPFQFLNIWTYTYRFMKQFQNFNKKTNLIKYNLENLIKYSYLK